MYLKYDVNHTFQELSDAHFEVLSVTQISYDVNWHSTLHYHDFMEIFYCLEGEGYIQTNYGQQPVRKDSFVIVNPYIEHTEHTSILNPLKYLVIGIRGPEIILPNHAFDNGLYCVEDMDHNFLPFFQEILEECEHAGSYSSQIIDYLVNLMLLKLSNSTESRLEAKRNTPLSASVSVAKNYMDNHYSNNITLDVLEQRTHISRFHLSHLFKAELGVSPINYLIDVRFSHAKTLLKTTNFSIMQIAELVGFNSVNFFSTKFKASFGCTPREYRLKHREATQ
ncbi:AraC family transcriptional regulator [Aerococcaceae bacterium NML130460]|nr:AraC family transcriptional regulator [Aerococcaceae bacterium NML171108]MCW6675939.1 AraC family transcriptional regulator [Aerococcaceae bacterium NML180378]MCW6680105.1 AraC family transcriptional regulator [Aerococcaceae bacterium NML130460]MDO4774491.1 AraC family transcriptional regulator [Aerococcaceae bacterium]